MHKIFIIARHEYLINVRRSGFIFMTLLFPLLGVIGLLVAGLFGGQAKGFLERQFANEPQAIGIVDQSGLFTPILPDFVERYQLLPDEAAGRAAVESDQVDLLLIISADYLNSGEVAFLSKEGGTRAAMTEDSSKQRAFFIEHLLRNEENPALKARLRDPVGQLVLLNVGDANAANVGTAGLILNMLVPFFLGILLVMTIFTSAGYLLQSVAEEKSSRVIEIIVSSVRSEELLAGKVLGLGALGLTQVVVWMASAVALSGGSLAVLGLALPLLSRPELIVLSLVYYLLGYLIFAMLMGSTGALGTTSQESQQIAGVFSMLAALPMMFSGFIISNPNMTVARVFSWFPLTAPTMMMMRLPMTRVPVIDIVGSIVLCVLTIPLILWAGARVFRMGMLMYGKRPSFREVWATLRQS